MFYSLSGIIQTIVGGLGTGTVYALLGISFTLIFGRLKICSVMHGDLAIFAAYIGYFSFSTLGIDPCVSLLVIIPVFFFLGYWIQEVFLAKFMELETWKGKYQGQIMVTFGLAMIIMATEYFLFTGTNKTVSVSYRTATILVGDIYVHVVTIISFLATIALVIFLELLLRKTNLGIQIRACSVDRVSSQLAGVNYSKVCAITFGISAAVSGVAGVFYSLRNPLGPSGGMEITFLGWVAVIIGGMGDLKGALLAGLLMGIVQNLVSYLWLPAYQEGALYLVLLIFLVVRPNGIFQKYVSEARAS